MDARNAEFEAVLTLGRFNTEHAGEAAGVSVADNERLAQFLARQRHQLAVIRRKEVHVALAELIRRYEDPARSTEDKRFSLLLPFGRTHPSAPPAYSGEVWASAALRYVAEAEEEEIAQGGLVYYVSHLFPPHGVENSPDAPLLATFGGRHVRAIRGPVEYTPHEDRLPSTFPTTLATHIISATMNDVHRGLSEIEIGLRYIYHYIGEATIQGT